MKITWIDLANIALWWLFWGTLLFGHLKRKERSK